MLVALFVAVMTMPVLAAPAPDPTAPNPGHIVAPVRDSKGAVTRESFEARFDAAAARFSAKMPGARADRFAAFDIAWPHDAAEWRAMNGNAVLLIGALAQDATELPLAKAYLTGSDGTQVALRRIGVGVRQLPPSTKSGSIFGPNMAEQFYLVPVAALDANPQLLCDFARNRLGFVLTPRLSHPAPPASISSASGQPSFDAIRAMVAREYPGFDITLKDAPP
jgi:hypothetical protein